MITKPLDLVSRLSPPPRDLDFIAWVNVGVVVLFFGLLGSRFILAPGVEMRVGGITPALDLPTVTGGTGGTGAASVVVSYRRDNVILFEGGMYSLSDLKKQMEAYIKTHHGAVMLVRVDRQVSMQAFLELSEMASSVGFVNVIVAAEPKARAETVR